MDNSLVTLEISPKILEEAVQRIGSSATFARASRALSLLRYLTDAAAAGKAGSLKEYTVAAEFFSRPDYDPKVHSLVRVEAAKLRCLLAKYYESEGSGDPVRIEVPKGSYAPLFSLVPPEIPEQGRATLHTSRRWLVAAAVAAVLILGISTWIWKRQAPGGPTPVASIAVLPFLDLTPAGNQEHLADGIAEEITNLLAQWNGIQVAPRRSAFQYKGQSVDVRRVGADLKVQAVLEGSVRVEGKQVRVTVQLVDAQNGLHLWNHAFDREVSELLKVQREIAIAVTRYLQLDMPDTRRALVRPSPKNPEAWQYYLRAMRRTEDPSPTVVLESIALFDMAVKLDPDYAIAWAAMARKLATFAEWGVVSPKQVMPRAEEAARRAVALDDSLMEAHDSLARIRALWNHDWLSAEREFRKAIELDSASIDSRFAYARYVLVLQGRIDEAATHLEQALALDPVRWDVQHELAAAFSRAGNTKRARAVLEKNPIPDSPLTLVWQGVFAVQEGRVSEALLSFQRAVERNPGRWTLSHLGYTLARAGRIREARTVLEKLLSYPASEFDQAVVHAGLGETERTLALLEKAESERLPTLLWLKVDYRLRDLHDNPRFRELLHRLGLMGSAAIRAKNG